MPASASVFLSILGSRACECTVPAVISRKSADSSDEEFRYFEGTRMATGGIRNLFVIAREKNIRRMAGVRCACRPIVIVERKSQAALGLAVTKCVQ